MKKVFASVYHMLMVAEMETMLMVAEMETKENGTLTLCK